MSLVLLKAIKFLAGPKGFLGILRVFASWHRILFGQQIFSSWLSFEDYSYRFSAGFQSTESRLIASLRCILEIWSILSRRTLLLDSFCESALVSKHTRRQNLLLSRRIDAFQPCASGRCLRLCLMGWTWRLGLAGRIVCGCSSRLDGLISPGLCQPKLARVGRLLSSEN